MVIIMETLFAFLNVQFVNVATYRHFTIGCLRLNYSKIKISLRLGYPTPISTTKDLICCSNGYIYHCFD